MTETDPHEVQLDSSILSSAYDFVERSLEQASQAEEGDQRRWKFAIIAIATSVELFLKERLRQEHPVLIYTKIDDGMRNTVSLEMALTRLRACNVAVDTEDAKRLNRAREIRNSISISTARPPSGNSEIPTLISSSSPTSSMKRS